MCSIAQHIILADTEDAQVSWCMACQSISLTYKCLCSTFTQDEIIQFKALLENLMDHDFHYTFMNQPHTLLKNACSPVGMCLTKADVASISKLLTEAAIMFEVHQIINEGNG